MSRALGLCLLVLSLAACRYDPPGQCSNDTECPFGRRCTDGVCVGCQSDADCEEWRTCDVTIRQCTTRADRCATARDCAVWEVCNDAHACVPGPDFCESDATCTAWQSCTDDHLCRPKDGRCDATADCEEWQVCDTSQTCVAAVGRCSTADECEEWETCASDHRCRLGTDRCNSALDCLGVFAGCDATHACVAMSMSDDGRDAVLWGTLHEGACGRDGLARLESPDVITVGFECYSDGVRLLPGGGAVYRHRMTPDSRAELRRFGPDRMVWDPAGVWLYPHPLGNDPVVPTTACQGDVGDVVPVVGTEELVYSCAGDLQFRYYDLDGLLVSSGSRVRAWNADGLRLLDGYQLFDASNQLIPTPGAPGLLAAPLVRVHGSGFRIAGIDAGLWEISADGEVTQVGSYEADDTFGENAALDAAGALYTETRLDGLSLVERHLPDGSPPEVVYDEADQPEGANDLTRDAFFLLKHDTELLTPP